MNDLSEKDFYKLYYDVNKAGSFSGTNSFIKAIKDQFNIKRLPLQLKNKIISWISKQDTYTRHKQIKKIFKRNKVISMGIDDTWQADLVDVTNIAKQNDNFKFILTIIDVFSKYGWAIPLKNKTSISIIKAFEKIFKKRKPNKLQTDKGKEFINGVCQKLLKNYGIQFYALNSEMKACVVERFNRTIREKMWRYFTFTNKKRYVEILPKLINSYNHTYHRSIKLKPIEVNKNVTDKVWFNLYGKERKIKNPPIYNNQYHHILFNINDAVRIAKYKTIFDKGYTPNWTNEIFYINKIILRDRPVFELRDKNNEIIKGVFYEEELQKVDY